MDDLIYGVEYRRRILAFKTLAMYKEPQAYDFSDKQFDNQEFMEVDDTNA